MIDKGYSRHVTHNGGWGAIMQHVEKRLDDKRARVSFVDCSEHYFLWNKNVLMTPWIGIVHYVDDLPRRIYPRFETLEGLVSSSSFQQSIRYCIGIIVLSNASVQKMREYTPSVPVLSIPHPIGLKCDPTHIGIVSRKFRWVVLLGQQYRKVATIYNLRTPLRKIWLPGMDPRRPKSDRRLREMVEREGILYNRTDVSIWYVNNNVYRHVLSKSIVIVDLWDASANNAVMDAISCKIPILINRLPAVEEYIGKDYPLYFTDFESLQKKVDSLRPHDMARAQEYLRSLDTDSMSVERFTDNIVRAVRTFTRK